MARREAAEAGHPVSTEIGYEVEQTLHAALADPDVAREVCGGRLVRPVERTGFGEVGAQPAAPTHPARPTTGGMPAATRTATRRGPGTDAPATAAERLQLERERVEREATRLRAERDAARSDLAAAEDELSAAEDRLAAAERSRDVATELIGSLEEQLNAARHRVRDSGRQIADARRRRDAATRARDAAARRLADNATRLAAHQP